MLKEIEFWDKKRSLTINVNGTFYSVYQFKTETTTRRPEAYFADMNLTKNIKSESQKRKIYQNVASATESGWDFSTRWMNESNKLITIQTTNIVPVDLNAIMCWNFKLISYLHKKIGKQTITYFLLQKLNNLGNNVKATYYSNRYKKFIKTIQVFYVKNESGWYDFNIKTKQHNLNFYASNAVPLFTGCYDKLDLELTSNIFDKMKEMGIFNFVGGIPTR